MGFRVAALCVAVSALAALAPAAGAAEPLLPDLHQETPYDLGVVTDGKRFHLGFASVVYNYGDGPLRIDGSRASRSDPTMTATQVMDSDDGSSSRVERVGELRYVDSVTHRHWHYLKFDTYSLRRPDGSLARPDRKTGFCLGDRLRAPRIGPLPAMPSTGEYASSDCGYDSPDLLSVEEGISVGYGDDYAPQLEGQFVDLTRLRAGRYVLVHRANADGALREKSVDNNAASVLIDLRWRRGLPRVTQVARCPLSDSCPVAPRLTTRRATQLAREALLRAYRQRVAPVSCAEPVDGGSTCTGPLAGGAVATVAVRYSVRGGRLYWTFAATTSGDTRPRRGRVALSLGRKVSVPVARQSRLKPADSVRTRVAYCPLIARG